MREILSRFKSIFLHVGIFSFFVNVLLLAPSIYMMMVFDRVIPSKSAPTLVMLTLGVFGLLLVMLFLEYLRSRLMIAVSSEIDHVLGPRMIEGMLDRATSPTLVPMAASQRDILTLRTFLSGHGVFALFDAPWLPLYIGLIFLFSPVLGTFALIGTLMLAAIGVMTEVLTRRPLDAMHAANARSARFVDTAVRNAEVVGALNMKPALRRRWHAMNSNMVAAHVLSSDRVSLMMALTKFARQFIQMFMMAVGVYLLIDQSTSPGVMLAATFIMGRAMMPVEQLVATWPQISEARIAYRRLAELLAATPQAEEGLPLPTPRGHVQVEQVVFAIQPTGRPILRSISFEVKPGESLGIVGPSASGKSTLARLLVGVWKPAAGSVRLDGAVIAGWLNDSRGVSHIGYLPQDVELFPGTVAENIARLGEIDSEAVVKAATRAHAHEMILRLPKGYDTEIGDGGAVLSGGQRQRVGLARALYGDPRFVVLDEPNANLDSEGEDALMRTLSELKTENVAVVVIAHRPAIFARFDRIMVLREGMIDAIGPREEILARYGAPAGGQA